MNYLKLENKALVFLYIIAFLFACKTEPSQKDKPTLNADANVVNIRTGAEPDVLNPNLTYSGYATQINSNIFSFLLDLDPTTLELVPSLAIRRPIVEEITSGEYKGGAAYTYEIRKEAVWDDGKPVLASDYIFTLKSIFNPAMTARAGIIIRGGLNMIKDVKIDPKNPRKFTVFTDIKFFTGEATTGYVTVMPEHIYDARGLLKKGTLGDFTNKEKAEKLKDDPQLKEFDQLFQSPQFTRETVAGCGPYRLESWETGQRIVLKKKENWWGDALAKENPIFSAYPKQLTYLPIKDENGALVALKAQDIDLMHMMSFDNYVALKNDASFLQKFDLSASPSLNWFIININNNNPKLRDKKTRQALAHLVDYDEILNVMFNGLGQRIVGTIHPSRDYYHRNLKFKDLDTEKAKQLLSEAGWKDTNNNGILDKEIDGKQLEFTLEILHPSRGHSYPEMAALLQKNLKQLGIQLKPISMEFNEQRKRLGKRDFELSFTVKAGYPFLFDPYQVWHTESRGNESGFGNAESDALIEELRQTLDKEKRNMLYLKFQEILYEEQPVVFLFNTSGRLAVSNRFKNAELSLQSPGYHPRYFQLK